MSSLRTTLRLASYRDSLRLAITHSASDVDSLRSALRYGTASPAGVEANTWVGMVGATRLAYEAGIRDGAEAVAADIASVFADELGEDVLSRFFSLLAPDESISERIAGAKLRDSLLPNLISSSLAMDLRVLSSSGAGLSAAPVITVRLAFDEHVGGQEAIVFQASVESLEALIEELSEVRNDVQSLIAVNQVVIPNWARGVVAAPDGDNDE